MKVAHICPETGEHYIVSARWNGDEYEPCCGHCDDEEIDDKPPLSEFGGHETKWGK